MHPKQTPSHLNSNKEKTIVRPFFQGGRAGGSSVSILEKPIEKKKLVTTITPGGPCASSVIILSLDPHLVDASVNFVDLGYLHSLCLHLLVAILHFRLRLSFLLHIGGRQVISWY